MTSIERYAMPPILGIRLGLLAAGLFVVGTNGFVIAGVLPAIAADLHTPQAGIGYSVTVYAAVVAVTSPLIAIFAARVPRTALMVAGLVLVVAGTAIAASAGSLGAFVTGRAVAGLGGAALVPAATAAAPALLPAAQRGRALAIAALGFTLATAIGSPFGTLLAAIGGWRLPLGILAGMALLLAVLVAVLVRGVPVGVPVGLRARFAPLADPRVLLVLIAVVLLTAGFNVVYLFSAEVVHGATGGAGAALATLLLVYGLAGIAGTSASGRMTDRWGSTRIATLTIGIQVVVLAVLAIVASVFALDVAVFALWGSVAFAAVVPLQYRLIALAPADAPVLLSWYSTALYVGIAAAPIIGAAALVGTSADVPLAGAGASVLAVVAFLLASRIRVAAGGAAEIGASVRP